MVSACPPNSFIMESYPSPYNGGKTNMVVLSIIEPKRNFQIGFFIFLNMPSRKYIIRVK